MKTLLEFKKLIDDAPSDHGCVFVQMYDKTAKLLTKFTRAQHDDILDKHHHYFQTAKNPNKWFNIEDLRFILNECMSDTEYNDTLTFRINGEYFGVNDFVIENKGNLIIILPNF